MKTKTGYIIHDHTYNIDRNEKSHLKDIDESPTTLSNLNELAKEAFERSDSELSKQ